MREPELSADITERLRYHIEWLAKSGYPATLQRDALDEIVRLRQQLGIPEAVASVDAGPTVSG
ncbi:MAG TPA: hypothetical protein VIQ53_21915 [Inquilinus sp.]